jgi:hypothetical protein
VDGVLRISAPTAGGIGLTMGTMAALQRIRSSAYTTKLRTTFQYRSVLNPHDIPIAYTIMTVVTEKKHTPAPMKEYLMPYCSAYAVTVSSSGMIWSTESTIRDPAVAIASAAEEVAS